MIVVKFGGHAMSDEHGGFSRAIKEAIDQGVELVIVHGGGPQINRALESAHVQSTFVGGFRVTTPEVFEIVERVLATEVGPQIADSLKQAGIDAVALSGRTSGVLIAQQQKELVDGSTADLGLVGEIIDVKSEPLVALIRDKKIPVIAPLATDSSSLLGFNVNADIAAAAVAGALAAQWLIIMTDVPGIYRYWPDTSSLIESITADELRSIKETFAEGMAPKVQACLDAIEAGALAVRIIDGRDPSALKDALLGKGGTLVIA